MYPLRAKISLVIIVENNEGLIGKDSYVALWENLAAQLNDIGPPEHTSIEWKKNWSEHKYNKRRSRSSGASLDEKRGKIQCFGNKFFNLNIDLSLHTLNLDNTLTSALHAIGSSDT